MNLLDIKDPKFLKDLSVEQLEQLAQEIRVFLLDSVSKTGGHLSSNLGVVELTIALHYSFNAPVDKILFDVGHQSYVHKILTGRASKFNTLRQFGGIAGFQKREESVYDCFEAGHSSTALSTALGMAVARDLDKENYNVIPVVGDASMMSGLSLEALNNIGYIKSKVIIVFNDNNMSISKNVGILTKNFANLRNSKTYLGIKEEIKEHLKQTKHGESYVNIAKNVKKAIKSKLIDSGFFDEFDLDYLGPIDGHNINDLINAFNAAKLKDGPVVVHVVTKKGKGYKYTEEDKSGTWHGVERFELETGKLISSTPENYKSFSSIVSGQLERIMDRDENVIVITPAMVGGSKLNNVFAKYPNRCFDCGIAEDHALTFASGLALSGKKPFVSIYSSFIQRAYDQINHDLCRMNLPVVIGIDRASIVGKDGETHQGVFDISFLRPIPNIVICEGKDANQIENLLNLGFKTASPFVLRYPRGSIEYHEHIDADIELGKWEKIVNNDSEIATIISYGPDVDKIASDIINNHLPYNLINALFIKPVDEDMILEVAKRNKPIFVYTNDILMGGLGDAILEVINKNQLSVPVYMIGVDDMFVKHGDIIKIKENLGLDLKSLYNFINEHA